MFFNFLIFFFYFFRNFLARVEYERNSGVNFFFFFFFFTFSAYLISFWQKIMLENGFSIFNFLFSIFFRIFFPRLRMNGIRDKFFFPLCFLLYHPVFANNNAGKRFFNFLNFFAIFFAIFFPGWSLTGIRD